MMLGQRDPKFFSELKQLNTDLIDYLKLLHDKSPYFDFSPTIQDYVKQISDLEKQYPENGFKQPAPVSGIPTFTGSLSSAAAATSSAPAPNSLPAPTSIFSTSLSTPPKPSATPAPAPLFTAAAPATTTTGSALNQAPAPQLPFSFGSVQTPTSFFNFSMPSQNKTEDSSVDQNNKSLGISFGTTSSAAPSLAASVAPTTTTQAPTSFFSFTMPPKKDDDPTNKQEQTGTINFGSAIASATSSSIGAAADANSGDDEEHHPPEPVIDKYDEPDSMYSVKCKLYEKRLKSPGSNEFTIDTLGIGMMFLKSLSDASKMQCIVRQEPDLRRVLLNEVVTANIPVKLLPKAIQIVFPISGGETKLYIMKLKDETDANNAYEMLSSLKNKANSAQ